MDAGAFSGGNLLRARSREPLSVGRESRSLRGGKEGVVFLAVVRPSVLSRREVRGGSGGEALLSAAY